MVAAGFVPEGELERSIVAALEAEAGNNVAMVSVTTVAIAVKNG